MSELLEKLDTKEIKEEEISDSESILKPKKIKQVCSQKKLDALKNNRIKAVEAVNKTKNEKELKKAKELIEKDLKKQEDLKPVKKVKEVIVEPEEESESSEEE